MTESAKFRFSHDLTVVAQAEERAYLISCNEWDFLKARIKAISPDKWFFKAMAFLLYGVSGSTLISLSLDGVAPGDKGYNVVIAKAIVLGCVVAGTLCTVIAIREGETERERANDVTKHMEIIESRFDRGATNPA